MKLRIRQKKNVKIFINSALSDLSHYCSIPTVLFERILEKKPKLKNI